MRVKDVEGPRRYRQVLSFEVLESSAASFRIEYLLSPHIATYDRVLRAQDGSPKYGRTIWDYVQNENNPTSDQHHNFDDESWPNNLVNEMATVLKIL